MRSSVSGMCHDLLSEARVCARPESSALHVTLCAEGPPLCVLADVGTVATELISFA